MTMSSWSDVRAIGRGDSDDDMAGRPPYVGSTLRNSWPRLRAGLFLGLPLALRPLAVCDYRFAGGVDVIAETYAIAVLVLAAPVPVVTKFAPLDLPLLVLTVAVETANAPRRFQIGRIRVIEIRRHESGLQFPTPRSVPARDDTTRIADTTTLKTAPDDFSPGRQQLLRPRRDLPPIHGINNRKLLSLTMPPA
jgi:hypothetical protein